MKNTLLLFVGLIGFSFSLSAQNLTEKEKVVQTVSKANIEGHIYFLADDPLKGRATGTPELKIAASYLASSFRRYGVKPNPKTGTYYQDVPLQKTSPGKFTLTAKGEPVPNRIALQSVEIKYSGDAVFLNYGLEVDYNAKDVTN